MNKTITKNSFLKRYCKAFKLDSDKIKGEIWAITNKYKVTWTELGPILHVKLYGKVAKFPKFCWGEYNILLNVFNIDNFLVTSTAKVIRFNSKDYAIHPNIHSDIYTEEKYGNLVCLGDTYWPTKLCIKGGELYEACEILINMLNNCKGRESLSYYWNGIHYSMCDCCGQSIELGKSRCRLCQ